MILHLVDDEKVINRAIDFFEKALPGQNIYLCFCNKDSNNDYRPQHVKGRNIVFYDYDQDNASVQVENADKVIVHSLYLKKVRFIDRFIRESVPVCWILWGADLYNEILFRMGYPLYSMSNVFLKKKEWLYNKIKHYIGYKSPSSNFIIDFIRRRITSICCCDGDFELLQRYIKIGDIKRVNYYYYPIEDVMGPLYGKSVCSNANLILCGNSAAETNNHQYLLKYLKKLGIGDNKVVMPLSYCGTEEYKELIAAIGHDYFGDSFYPLFEFVPLEKYNNFFLNAGICIYSSWRQMAVGNITVALYLGSKVFLSKHNPWTKDAANLGLKFFYLESAGKQDFLKPLSEEEKASNRRIIEDVFSSDKLVDLIISQFGE